MSSVRKPNRHNAHTHAHTQHCGHVLHIRRGMFLSYLSCPQNYASSLVESVPHAGFSSCSYNGALHYTHSGLCVAPVGVGPLPPYCTYALPFPLVVKTGV
ncbi:unnamed protein product [Discosporangium mesarthrocarpum]